LQILHDLTPGNNKWYAIFSANGGGQQFGGVLTICGQPRMLEITGFIEISECQIIGDFTLPGLFGCAGDLINISIA